MRSMAVVIGLTGLLMAAPIVGCHRHKGPAERAGAKIDSAVETAGDKAQEAGHKVGGAVEKAGDKIEDATDR